MSWHRYDLVFRLLAPLHIGWRKTSNLQQTRGYVPGKNQWAALTARLTRDYDNDTNALRYQEIGEQVLEHFRFSYLYPALSDEAGYTVHYPWEDDFDYLFLDSYASAALDYTSQSAADGLLHETEFIASNTRDGRPVYLVGTVYVQTHLPGPLDKWQDALNKFQFGGERGYGWGSMRKVTCERDEAYNEDEPKMLVAKNGCITAHLKTENMTGITGPVEALIGWERNHEDGKPNWSLSKKAVVCYAPGANVEEETLFAISHYGIWEKVTS
ncbi:MAG: hypothetical protein CSB13_11025 [Chloroflexi bacterium]|nr:MAG: hypothetical protein CSB13_11025 [Chloroflexota bacterium]